MEFKGSKTEKNLWEAFAGESQARNKYTYFASKARAEGFNQIAAIFEETAGNEKEHAKIWFKLLCGGAIPDTLTCLDMAAGGEHDEWTEMYPRMAKEAKEEGFPQIAALFTMAFFSTVTPGQLPTNWLEPVSALNSVVFPQFGLPARAILRFILLFLSF